MTAEFVAPAASLLATEAGSQQEPQSPEVVGRMIIQGLIDQAPHMSEPLTDLGSRYVANMHSSSEAGAEGDRFMNVYTAIGSCPHFAKLADTLVGALGPEAGVAAYAAAMQGEVESSKEAVEEAQAAGFLGR